MIDIVAVEAELASLNKMALKREIMQEECQRLEGELVRIKTEQTSVQQARLLLLDAGREARRKVKEILESVVTRALQVVFDQSYRFEVEISDEGKEAQVAFYVICGDPPVREEPTDAMGGGVVDIVSLALRIAFLELCEPRIGGPLVLDEPGRHLDKTRSVQLGAILSDLSHEFGRQVIVVTHDEALAHSADAAYKVTHTGVFSEVEKL